MDGAEEVGEIVGGDGGFEVAEGGVEIGHGRTEDAVEQGSGGAGARVSPTERRDSSSLSPGRGAVKTMWRTFWTEGFDHAVGEIGDAEGFAGVGDEEAAYGMGDGFGEERGNFGESEEVAAGVGMGDGDRDLRWAIWFAKMGPTLAGEPRTLTRRISGEAGVGEDDLLGEAFGGAHDAVRGDGLVGGDEEEARACRGGRRRSRRGAEVPRVLVAMAAKGSCSMSGTCLSAAAWRMRSGAVFIEEAR